MTKIVSILNQKGGVGKTTLATHIATGLYLLDQKTLLVDSDPQGSARDWRAACEDVTVPVVGLDRPTLAKDIKAVLGGYDWVVVDGAPQMTALAVSAITASDVILIPVQPSPYDIWASHDLVNLIKERQALTGNGPKAAFVISRQIKNTVLAKEVRDSLVELGLPLFKSHTNQRVIYATAANIGKTAFEIEPDGAAASEIQAIVEELVEFANGEA